MNIQTVSDALDIIVSNQKTPLVPDTGALNLNSVESTLVIPAAIFLIVAIALFFFNKRIFKKKPHNFVPSIILFLLALCLATPASISALNTNTKLYITKNADAPVIATAKKSITLNQDYPNGYTVFAYADTDDGFTLYNEDHSASIAITNTVSDKSSLKLNSYGIKSLASDVAVYGSIAMDADMPTIVATSLESAAADNVIDIEYIAKLDSATPEGVYSTDFSNIEFHYEVYPGRPLPVSSKNDGFVDRIMALSCVAGACKDIDGKKYVRPEGKTYYTPAFDINFAVTPEGYGAIAPLYFLENVPYGSGVSIDNNTITINGSTFTASPNVIPDEHTYFFEEWDTTGLTTDGVISDMTFTAKFTRVANQYTINLNAGEDVIYLGTGQIYVVYGADFYRNSDKNYKMSTSENKISIPTRTGYIFAGYYTEPDGAGTQFITENGYLSNDADPTFFTKEKVDAEQNTLYADWTSADFFSITTMQEMTAGICATATTPTVVANVSDTTGIHAGDASYVPTRTLIDSRDNQEYTVKKLADGKCWMTSNLNLALNANTALTKDNTDLNGIDSWTPASSTIALSAEWIYNDNVMDVNKPQSIRPAGDPSYDASFGTYYSWAAAVASNDTSTIGMTPNAPNSICPKGWRLPYAPSVENSEFMELAKKYGASYYGPGNIFAEPANFIKAGEINLNYVGISTMLSFWTSSPMQNGHSYIQKYDTSLGNSVNTYESRRDIGASVRCVAR